MSYIPFSPTATFASSCNHTTNMDYTLRPSTPTLSSLDVNCKVYSPSAFPCPLDYHVSIASYAPTHPTCPLHHLFG